ncbi:single-stranded DNA-binding protein [Spiroplasma endosymbiont of 'Nebria riversi']|uniref:single-stranded DNA-binding protein n=1 Tax=Spiroplasma endosymbiont of 'Nebria riversi' TaxID=2792084 RepID=UPI001C05802C|nr:single-stranded DNA-binding protein [Spiroplasma endosymbiont of 'Nebria riversi']
MLNKVILIGRITNDLNLRSAKNNKSFLYFTIAINNFNHQADFINCVAWEKVADSMYNNLRKGSLVLVEGCIQSRKQEQNGVLTTITDVRAISVKFLDSRGSGGGAGVGNSRDAATPSFVNDYNSPVDKKIDDQTFNLNNMNFNFVNNDVVDNKEQGENNEGANLTFDNDNDNDDAIAWGE